MAGRNDAGPCSMGSCRYIGMAPIMCFKPGIFEHLQFSNLSRFYRKKLNTGCFLLPLHTHPCPTAAGAPSNLVWICLCTATFCWESQGTAQQPKRRWHRNICHKLLSNVILRERWNSFYKVKAIFLYISYMNHSNFIIKENEKFVSHTPSSLTSFDTQA